MSKSWHVVVAFVLGILIGSIRVTVVGHEAKAGSPTTQKSDREVALADYGFHEWAGGCSLVIISPTMVKICDVPGVGPRRFFPSGSDFAVALEHLGRYRHIKHVVPVTGTLGEWRRRNGWSDSKLDDGESRTAELLVITDDPRNPEKR